VLRLVFGDDNYVAPARVLSRAATDFKQYVRLAIVEYALRGIKTKTVEVKLVDPVAGVRYEEFAHGA
jgi:hypothetical protein